MNSKKLKIVIAAVAAVLLLTFLVDKSIKRTRQPITIASGYRKVMGTFAKITVTAKTRQAADKCINKAFDKIESVEKMMSRRDSNSMLSFVNANAFKEPVKVDPELFYVLSKSIEYSKKSGGAFDITVAPLIILWQQCAEANSLPTQARLREIRKKIGYKKLLINADNKTVRFKVDGMMLDLGAIAKGYAIDLAIETMKKQAVYGGLVDIGGDIRCFGKPPKDKNWIIGLQNPAKANRYLGESAPGAGILLKLKLRDKAIATSGDYQRYVTIGGKRYSHIINPATETSADKFSSVTIIAAEAIDADAMATAVSVLGVRKGLALIEKTPGVEGILIPTADKNELIKSSGVDKYIDKYSVSD